MIRPEGVKDILNIRRGDRRGPGVVYIGRGSVYGNPYVIGPDGTREEVIAKYESYYRHWLERSEPAREALRRLRGRSLLCYCHPLPCHGDVLRKLVAEQLDKEAS